MTHHLDDLPRRSSAHITEEKALSAFQCLLAESGAFIVQGVDRKDYGTDCQIEAISNGQATNVRVHVQVKGTEQDLNSDGSFTVQISRTNLNYLLAQPYSLFVGFHVPTQQLRFTYAEELLRHYEHSGTNWTTQKTLTVPFSESLTTEQLETLSDLVKSGANQSRNERTAQVSSESAQIGGIAENTAPNIHVPADKGRAIEILEELYETGADHMISAAFDKFASVIGTDSAAFGPCFMAEINLGMAARSNFPERIKSAIGFFEQMIRDEKYLTGSIHYSIGNAYSALGDEAEAKACYEKALQDNRLQKDPDLAAQVYKNLGASIEKLGFPEDATKQYIKALELSPNLPEAHNALGNYYIREGLFQNALDHFDQVVFGPNQKSRMAAVSGWRVNALFNLDQGRAAFREINTLLSDAQSDPWVWPWCARQVASFGRASVENARLALVFWERLVREEPDVSVARRELLLTRFFLRSNGQDIGFTFEDFCDDFVSHVSKVTNTEDVALLWDRLGHWAQDNSDWVEAERCYRMAFDLAGGDYGFCLGTALNFLGRYEESLPVLVEQAEVIQPDAMSWFQVAVAHEKLGNTPEAIDAYQKAISLDPEYDLALFNLGGVYWNAGFLDDAKSIWSQARKKFPNHQLKAKLDREFSFVFEDE